MRKTTWQTATTDEPKISTLGVDEIPVAVCDTGTIKNLGAHFLRPADFFFLARAVRFFGLGFFLLKSMHLGHFAC